MKNVFYLWLLLACSSCNYFSAQKVSSTDILNEQLKTFTWDEVDEYPLFLTCASSAKKAERKTCFQQTLIQHMSEYLHANTIEVKQEVSDTIFIHFKIYENGKPEITQADIDTLTMAQIPEIEQFVRSEEHTSELQSRENLVC